MHLSLESRKHKNANHAILPAKAWGTGQYRMSRRVRSKDVAACDPSDDYLL